jgi:hypothetical protein
MTDTNNGWPGKPGVPLSPKQNGAHKIGRYFLIWRADTQDYVNHNGNVLPPEVAFALPYLGPCLTPDQATALQARVAELEGALKDAAASVGEWGAYASQYLQEKWGLPGEVARYVAIAEGKNAGAKEGKKDE